MLAGVVPGTCGPGNVAVMLVTLRLLLFRGWVDSPLGAQANGDARCPRYDERGARANHE